MNRNLIPYIYILFFFSSFQGVFAQDFTLKLVGKDSTETNILNQLNFVSKHENETLVFEELNSIKKEVQKLGYFTNVLVDILRDNFVITAQFSLGPKIGEIVISIPERVQQKYQNLFFINKDSIALKPFEIENYIERVIQELDQSGKSFSEVQLVNPIFDGNSLSMDLSVVDSEQRTISKVIVKGYENFPSSFINKYFKIDSKKIFSKKELEEISRVTKSLDFVEEIKPPEVLFKRDSTIVYLFLKRKKNSTVDGIVNFASKDDGSGLLINGNLDLQLKNVLNTGERFNLFWNRVKEENSEFRLNTYIPYIFNSSLSPELSFNIYRQDSTFLTTSFLFKLQYELSRRSKVFVSYDNETSDYLLDINDIGFDTFSKNFWSVGYGYSLASSNSKYDRMFRSEITAGYGLRKGSDARENQFKISLNSEINLSISQRGYFNLRNVTGYLNSKTFLTNELFRIGGANSIRGFNEQSIFTNQFSHLNIEYRYLTSIDSYLHTITDFGVFNNLAQNTTDTLLGLGFGYLFSVENNQINLGYALGVKPGDNFDFDQSKLIIRFTSKF